MDLPGIEVRPIKYMDGKNLYNEIYFTDVKVHESDLIGEEHQGWRLTRDTMNFERSGATRYIACANILKELIAYVKTTKRDGKFLSENPIVRQKIAKLHIDIEVGLTLAYKIVWLQDKGGLSFAASAASESKVFGTELLQRCANYATEIMGLHGQLAKSKWAPMDGSMIDDYQFCVGSNIAAGTSEIQRNLIAWVGLQLPRLK
jgi:alkylation response protein AidB-like acyl-CoA dehydrogenase